MDDLTLFDFLECFVCFEKFDVIVKVLFCQYIFCKLCLQRIFKVYKELRCFECRILVFCSIEVLSVNLLFVRFLDGVRSGQSAGRVGFFRRFGVLISQDSRKSRISFRGLQFSFFRLVFNIRIYMDGVRKILFVFIMFIWRLDLGVLVIRNYFFLVLFQSVVDDFLEIIFCGQ